jgi:hypothetical protein
MTLSALGRHYFLTGNAKYLINISEVLLSIFKSFDYAIVKILKKEKETAG